MSPPADAPGPGAAAPAAGPLRAPAASVAGRAALALALLVGYLALALLVVGGLAFLSVETFVKGGAGALGGKLAVFTTLVAGAVGRAVFTVERRGDDHEDGVSVTRAEQPELWGLVEEVSRDLGVPPPDDLRLVDDVNAFVHQDTRLLGLVGGRRRMGLGAALLQVLTVDELRGVVAHELGHYAGGDTRLSALVYRASTTMVRTVRNLGPESLLGRLFALYAALYQRVSLAVRRRQELRADEGTVRVVGRAAHESALRTVHGAAAAWSFLGEGYVVPLWRSGTAPRDLYRGYRTLLADPVRRQEVAQVQAADDGPADPYDSHPSLAARLAHARTLPDRPPPGDRRPARALLRDADAVEARVTALVNGRVLQQVPDALYDLGPELDPEPYVAELPRGAAELSRATASVDGGPQPAGLGRTLALLEAGRDGDLVTALTGDRRDLGEQARRADLRGVVAGHLALGAELAAVRAGRASWRATWSGPVTLVTADGRTLDVPGELQAALQADGVAGLRPALARLGVPLDDDALPVVETQDDRDAVLAVWPEVRRRGRWFDLLVTAERLLVVPQPTSLRARLLRGASAQYGLGKDARRRDAAERVQALLAVPPDELAARPGVHVVVWDALPSVVLRRGLANAWVLRLPLPKPLDTLKADDLLAPPPEAVDEVLQRLVGARLASNV